MSTEPDAPEIEITDDETTQEVSTVGTEQQKPDIEPKIVSGEEGAAELKKKLDAEQAARVAAEARARQADEEAARARKAQQEGEDREIETGLEVAKRNLELARKSYRDARTANDVEAELEATEAIAQAKADIRELEGGKVAREAMRKNPPQAQQQVDPVEALAADIGRQWPQSAQWIRGHADVVRKNWGAIRAASDLALASGLTADTPAYFEHIESTLQANKIMPLPAASQNGNSNGNGAHVEVRTEEPMSQASRPVAPAAAPVSRTGAAPGQQKPGTIRLSREQAEIAEMSFPELTKKEGPAAAHRAYAKAMVEARAAGKIN